MNIYENINKNTEKKKNQENHRGIPGANLTYLVPQDDFNGCKIVHWDPRNVFVHRDKFVCTMKKCMVSIATINTIFEHGHVHTKLVMYPLLFILDH